MLVYVLGLELLIVAATGFEAWARQTGWLRRWSYWHLAPLWFGWLVGLRALRRASLRTAHRAVMAQRRRPAPLALVERLP